MSDQLVRDGSLDVQQAVMARQEQKTSMDGYQHGDYVPGEDGEPGGILIDREEVMRKETQNPHVDALKEYIENQDKQIAAIQNHGSLDYSASMQNSKTAEQDVVARSVPSDPMMADIKKVSEAFASVEITNNGVAPVGSQEAREFNEKMDAWERGEITPEAVAKAQEKQQNTKEQEPTPVQQQEESFEEEHDEVSGNVVQFNVDAKNAETFLTTLTPEQRQKIDRVDTIVVNEIKKLDIPVATRTIASLDEFKKVIPKQSHSGVVETVNINGGYIATFKGCGALALASILPDDDPTRVDYRKRMNFCYENLVTTSLGKMSFNDFCLKTHINDIPNMLLNILRASDPDENSISLECPDCGSTYEVKYRLSELLDLESITPEMDTRIGEIVAAKDIYDNAKAEQLKSAIMQSKYLEIAMDDGEKIIVEIKSPNATKVIEFYPKLQEYIEKYSRWVASFLPYIHRIYMTRFNPETSQNDTFEIMDTETIAQILRNLTKTSIQAITKMVEGIQEYPAPRYSFKGKFRCPKCGREVEHVPCNIDDLIFYQVEQAMA